jgi:hypothetical protein
MSIEESRRSWVQIPADPLHLCPRISRRAKIVELENSGIEGLGLDEGDGGLMPLIL